MIYNPVFINTLFNKRMFKCHAKIIYFHAITGNYSQIKKKGLFCRIFDFNILKCLQNAIIK